MTARTHATIMRVIAVALAAFIAISIVLEISLYGVLIGVVVAMVLAVISRRFVKEITTDERNRRIEEKATAFSYRVYTIVTAAFALVAMLLRSRFPSWMGIAAQTLAYSLCGLMLMHLAATKYYGKKL